MQSDGFTPLAGIRVLEVAQNLAGPYCSQILHDLGATITKIEPSGTGDPARAWAPPYVGGFGSIFASANRGKRSVTLDLRASNDGAVLRELIAESDVLIEALRPGALAGLGFGYDVARALNDRLIYCSVLAYGETGPLRTLPGYDPLMQAHAGIMSLTGEPGRAPSRVGTSVVDMGAGIWLALGVVAALRERDRTGAGMRVSVALYDTALTWNAYHLLGYVGSGFEPARMGTELAMIAPYGAFPARDGQLMIAAANDGLFRRLCHALGCDELTDDPRYHDNPARVAHRDVLRTALAAATSAHTVTELHALLLHHGVPCAPVQDIAAVAADPQTAASELLQRDGEQLTFALPLRFNGQRPPARGTVPRTGAHTAEIVAERRRG